MLSRLRVCGTSDIDAVRSDDVLWTLLSGELCVENGPPRREDSNAFIAFSSCERRSSTVRSRSRIFLVIQSAGLTRLGWAFIRYLCGPIFRPSCSVEENTHSNFALRHAVHALFPLASHWRSFHGLAMTNPSVESLHSPWSCAPCSYHKTVPSCGFDTVAFWVVVDANSRSLTRRILSQMIYRWRRTLGGRISIFEGGIVM